MADRAPSAAASVIDPLAAIARPKDRPPYTRRRKMGRTRASSRAAVPRSSPRVRRNRCIVASCLLCSVSLPSRSLDDEQRIRARLRPTATVFGAHPCVFLDLMIGKDVGDPNGEKGSFFSRPARLGNQPERSPTGPTGPYVFVSSAPTGAGRVPHRGGVRADGAGDRYALR